MRPDVKSEWVDALRSGDYQQGVNYLRAGDKFCCLGVLCDLAVHYGVIPEPSWKSSGSTDIAGYGPRFEDQHLPTEVIEWAGVSGNNPTVTKLDDEFGECEDTLAELNDFGLTFGEIADLINDQY